MFAMMMVETGSPDERIEKDETPTNGLPARKGWETTGRREGVYQIQLPRCRGAALGKQIRVETVPGRPGYGTDVCLKEEQSL